MIEKRDLLSKEVCKGAPSGAIAAVAAGFETWDAEINDKLFNDVVQVANLNQKPKTSSFQAQKNITATPSILSVYMKKK